MNRAGKWFRFACGLALVPACVAVTRADWLLVKSVYPSLRSAIPPAGWALITGFMLWTAIYVLLPRPLRAYVLSHEITHALWGWVMGATVHSIRVKKDGGSTTLSHSNFLITLAPYFFPLYTLCVILAYYLLLVFFDLRRYQIVWLGLIGFTWGFHATFSISSLLRHQTDIREQGRLFSAAVIVILNLLGIGLWIVLVASPGLRQFVQLLSQSLAWAYGGCGVIARWVWEIAHGGGSPPP
ncbi:MAG: hypothetical protein JXR37_11175 [Kiritimatiellae bacterium]|nr:hypothetical protein [Kiritimatiellia bacterium]